MAATQEYRWIPAEMYLHCRKWLNELLFFTGGRLDPARAERTR
jgi:hypothetical protein